MVPETYSVTLTGSNGCDSVAIEPDAFTNHHQYNKQKVFVRLNCLTWNGQTYNGAGTYSVTLTGSNGCDSVATLPYFTNNNQYNKPKHLPYSITLHLERAIL